MEEPTIRKIPEEKLLRLKAAMKDLLKIKLIRALYKKGLVNEETLKEYLSKRTQDSDQATDLTFILRPG